MEWARLISAQRWLPVPEGVRADVLVADNQAGNRTEFERDYDRLVFSSPFRRLQNKTQVFPLPGSIFVHNRLTHTLEVASVGRSLGRMIGQRVAETEPALPHSVEDFGDIVSTACLAHDLGNPPFGHGGEDAISKFFQERESDFRKRFKLTVGEWADLADFEGNANTFRILTHTFVGRRPGGYALTYATLAATQKYPCESLGQAKGKGAHRKKYGVFQSEKEVLVAVFEALGIPRQSERPLVYPRHPLVYLVEAADDICNLVIDLEDAHRTGLFGAKLVEELLMACFEGEAVAEKRRINANLKLISDPRERVGYLRARAIHRLTRHSAEVFWAHHTSILAGKFAPDIMDELEPSLAQAVRAIQEISQSKIYNETGAVMVELSGYRILSELLELFSDAVLAERTTRYQRKILELMPLQLKPGLGASPYKRLQSVVDFVSGMTDVFAVDLYRRLFGIARPDVY